ncbi:hypothetical protein LEL_10599 [Akanthomyces lecanii RCEF 1005]|uniref:Uncharacterized protein n=1 Tax=Akanthomyces lecanii RCEF 1005 TaxID=1081108 RepID=A0A162J847_CORDF|nr:hypothetical protein LEL_10599 [Akanthomyces lecanii RCEF 1005]
MDPEDARKAVHLGASMPYVMPQNALELFKANAFGTLEGEAGAERAYRLRVLEPSRSTSLLTLCITRCDGAVIVVDMELVRTRYSVRLEHLNASIQECPAGIQSARGGAPDDQNGRTALPRQRHDTWHTATESQNAEAGRRNFEQSVDLRPANADLVALEKHTSGTKRKRDASTDEEFQPSREAIILSSASPSPSNGREEPFLRLGDGELATEVVLADFDRLADGNWLNDNLVNFYLVYLLLEFRRIMAATNALQRSRAAILSLYLSTIWWYQSMA